MKTPKKPTRTSLSQAAADLRADRRTLSQALDHAGVTPDADGRYCPDCIRLARELWAFRDTTHDAEAVRRSIERDLATL